MIDAFVSSMHAVTRDQLSGPSLPLRIGRYNVVGRLALGGMAEIFLAKLVGPGRFERPVVIKRVLPQHAEQHRFVHMFLDEARIAASIRHPNVVHVEDLGLDGQGLFLVMEYLAGETVAGLLRRLLSRAQRMPVDLCAYVVGEACAGLHAVHERGVVHRDVSPQNIFIGYDGSIKLLDFGIAKAADRITSTEAGELKGKVAYMSPEQCLGASVGPRSDVFSLGIVLYEMLAMRRLFHRATKIATLRAVLDDDVPSPDAASPEIPASVVAACLKALERDPDDRQGSALDLRRELRQTLTDDGALPERRLSQLMTALFAERIAQKEEMLRQLRSGMNPTTIPRAEADVEIELPSVVLGAPIKGKPPRRGRRWIPALALAALGAGTLALWALAPPPTTATKPRDRTVVEPAASEARADPAASIGPTEVRVEIESVPPGAELWLEGQRLDTTPAVLRLDRSDTRQTVRLSLRGYHDAMEELTPDVDQRLRVSLQPVERRRPRSRGAPPREAPTEEEREIRMFP